MLDLFTKVPVDQVIINTIMLALAIRGCVDFFAWCKETYKARFDIDYSKKKKEEKLLAHYEELAKLQAQSQAGYTELTQKLDQMTAAMDTRMSCIEKQLKQLTDSDMHDIKGWIVTKHHEYTQKGWVDDFTMDTIEKRFGDYILEGGNSYVEGLMAEIRDLPHYPPKE